ncbi:hypothetical protein T439DRAFT_216869 [Meredithblackwellia eburnea MCA 4105]
MARTLDLQAQVLQNQGKFIDTLSSLISRMDIKEKETKKVDDNTMKIILEHHFPHSDIDVQVASAPPIFTITPKHSGGASMENYSTVTTDSINAATNFGRQVQAKLDELQSRHAHITAPGPTNSKAAAPSDSHGDELLTKEACTDLSEELVKTPLPSSCPNCKSTDCSLARVARPYSFTSTSPPNPFAGDALKVQSLPVGSSSTSLPYQSTSVSGPSSSTSTIFMDEKSRGPGTGPSPPTQFASSGKERVDAVSSFFDKLPPRPSQNVFETCGKTSTPHAAEKPKGPASGLPLTAVAAEKKAVGDFGSATKATSNSPTSRTTNRLYGNTVNSSSSLFGQGSPINFKDEAASASPLWGFAGPSSSATATSALGESLRAIQETVLEASGVGNLFAQSKGVGSRSTDEKPSIFGDPKPLPVYGSQSQASSKPTHPTYNPHHHTGIGCKCGSITPFRPTPSTDIHEPDVFFHSIAAQTEFKDLSPEEIRFKNYLDVKAKLVGDDSPHK